VTVRSVREAMTAMGRGGQGDLSLMRELGGFWQGIAPQDPTTHAHVDIALSDLFAGLSGRHLNVNIITVGWDLLGNRATERADLDYAIHRLRTIFAPAGLGLGRVNHYEITSDECGGRDDLSGDSEADSLSDEWSVDDDGVDVFFVRTITASPNFAGISPIPGDCDKGGKSDGLVGGTAGRNDPDGLGRTLAHELGHFLDLDHTHGDPPACPSTTAGRNNLMSQTRCAVSKRTSVLLTAAQGSTMRGRCQVRAGV
jgi:hypothetical protein